MYLGTRALAAKSEWRGTPLAFATSFHEKGGLPLRKHCNPTPKVARK